MAATYQPFQHSSDAPGNGLLITVVVVSVLLHMVAITAFYAYSEHFAPHRQPRTPREVYVVHLIDPGPLTGRFETGRSSVVDAAPMPTAPAKGGATPSATMLLPPSKDAGEVKKVSDPLKKTLETKEVADAQKRKPLSKIDEAEKVKTSTLKQKKQVTETRDTESAAREVRARKGGGGIDIRKFPYEWYLRIMESRVYQNWDTLRGNYFTNRVARVTVYFQIDRGGNLVEAKVEHSSLNDELDKAALAAVTSAAPFPPLPPGYKEKSLEVHFGFVLEPAR